MSDPNSSSLPHHRLEAWHIAMELLTVVHRVAISDADCRAQARKSAKSCIANIAEGAGRRSRADKQRVYAIARGEVGECVAHVEIAASIGACSTEDTREVVAIGSRLSAMLWRLGG